jgi:hypothetical protein
MRFLSVFLCSALLVGCAGRAPEPAPADLPFDQRLGAVTALHNSGQYDALRTHFTKDAVVQSPVTPRSASLDTYLSALAADPYALSFAGTETIYSLPGRAVTRSQGTASSPGRFSLKETVTVDWRLEDGHWRIARLRFPEWPAVMGTWRKSGLKNEGSIELRILPGGTYVVFTRDDYFSPAFRGRYRLEANKITLTDTSANDPRDLQPGEGSYFYLRDANGITLRKVEDQNTWRDERFEGAWAGR